MAERMCAARRNPPRHTDGQRPCSLPYEFLHRAGQTMRKTAALLLACILIPQLLCAQQDDASTPDATAADGVEQVLAPKEVFVGDTAQINYTFRSAVDFFALADSKSIAGDKLSLSVSQTPFTELGGQCTVSSAELLREDLTYTLVITF